MQRIVILGSTGSIGTSTLKVISCHPGKMQVYALSAQTRIESLAIQAAHYRARIVIVANRESRARFISVWETALPMPEIRIGRQALIDTVTDSECDVVMAAIVGIAGLPATLAAVTAGKRVLLANKEALVAAGTLFMKAARKNSMNLIPIDSEHSAIFQCLPHKFNNCMSSSSPPGVQKLLLTASGGPFYYTDPEALHSVTPHNVCAHPNWRMGRKISVDSATMLNKGLEVIEAHWLFSMPPERIEILIHRKSIVHSLVEYNDGSILAQLSQPDMRIPIAYGLGFPYRLPSGASVLDLATCGQLDFEKPDFQRFPCLEMSFEALRAGQDACVVLNAANEIAVQSFLSGQIRYTDIPKVIRAGLEWHFRKKTTMLNHIDDVLELDTEARLYVSDFCLY